LFENHGILFDQFNPQPPTPHPQDDGEDGDEEGENNGEDNEERDDDDEMNAEHGPAVDDFLPGRAGVHDPRFILNANGEIRITHDIPNDEHPQEVLGAFPADQNEFYDFASSNIQVVPADEEEAAQQDIPATVSQPLTSDEAVNDDAPGA